MLTFLADIDVLSAKMM